MDRHDHITEGEALTLARLIEDGSDLRTVLRLSDEGMTGAHIIAHLRQQQDDDRADLAERATLAGMAWGTDGYNAAMGSEITPPEVCGHHCLGSGCRYCCD